MEKVKKLKRYSRKDYTQVVDFPVEIVGRDGVVRRYSFEASVRLYQRRIASAPSRYRDTEVVNAEVRHCRLRIEQLRKSYFHHYGWPGVQLADGPGVLAGQFAGEVVAFLRRFFVDVLDPANLAVTWVQDLDHAQVYFVQPLGADDDKYLLYLYAFRHHGACEGRERFFEALRTLRLVSGEGVESLVAFHHSADCGLVLTGRGGGPAHWPAREESEDWEAPSQPHEPLFEEDVPADRVAEGVRLLSDGETEHALQRFEQALSEEPYRRTAAVAVAALGDVLGQLGTSEMAARLGLHYAPHDPVLRLHLGLALFRQGRGGEARAELDQAQRLDPRLFLARILLALLAVADRDPSPATEVLQLADQHARVEDAALLLRLRQARRALVAEWVLAGLAAVALGATLVPVLIGGPLAPTLVLATGLALGAVAANRGLRHLTGQQALARLRIAPPEAVGSRGARLDDSRI